MMTTSPAVSTRVAAVSADDFKCDMLLKPASEAMPPTNKRAADDGSTSSANGTEPAVDDVDDVDTLALQAGLKKLRKIAVGTKAFAWVEGGYVWIAERH